MPELMADYVYVLRTCDANMTSCGGFAWKRRGWVEADDWNPQPVCGGGLHGLPWGVGDGALLNWSENAVWLAVRVDRSDGYVEFDGKCKFRRGYVVTAGTREQAISVLVRHGGDVARIVGAVVSGGDRAVVSGGDYATVSGGYGAVVTGGHYATVSGGYGAALSVLWWDTRARRQRIAVAYVGENGIKPNTRYALNVQCELKEEP